MTTRKEKLLQKLNPKLLEITPKLSGSQGSYVDLSTENSLENGAKKLIMRFLRNQDLCEKNIRNLSEKHTELTISSAKYNENSEICEIVSETLTLSLNRNDEVDTCERPGRRLQKLKMELQQKMSEKWEEEYKQRVKESSSCSKSGKKCSKEFLSDKEEEEEEEEEEDETNETIKSESDNDEEDDGVDADVECEGDEANYNKSQDENEDEFESCSLIPPYQPGGGMLYGGSELTQCEEGLPPNLLSPSLQLSINESSKLSCQSDDASESIPMAIEQVEEKSKLFSQNLNDSFDLNDAFEFCSGKFPDSQKEILNSLDENESEEDFGEDEGENEEEEEEDEDEDENKDEEKNLIGNVEAGEKILKTRKHIIAFEDSEDENETPKEFETEEKEGESLNFFTDDDETENEFPKKKKKSRLTLQFSDEESENEELLKEGEEEGEEKEEEEEEDDDQRSVHYDSEENEINPKEFFEKEAELSGSECSGDEDERGLDEFDVEEGDADQLDNDEVRSQLGKIHLRRVLDEDAREVRLIQEILFEDGDLHSDGKGRDRKFKWKNLGTFEDEGSERKSEDGEGGNSSDDEGKEEEEEKFRKMRLEKELFLMNKKGEESDDEIIEDLPSVKVALAKIISKTTEINETVKSSKMISKTSVVSNARGSFLTRKEEFLSKLAKSTSLTDNVLGPKSSKNFVFAAKSPEKTENTVSKRQGGHLEGCGKREKRIKLFPPEIDQRPSILNLMA